jgi:membrane protease YdiL (CAAX protease family)
MEKAKTELKFYHGLIIFAFLVIPILLFVCAPLQSYLGMIGLAITEIILLIIAIISAAVTGSPLKEVFPLKKPALRHIAAVIVFWAATTALSALGNAVIMFFLPGFEERLFETSRNMTGMFSTIPVWAGFLIVACMPAVCEEALHRGFIQYTMRGLKSKWLIVLIMGLIFGAFHLDASRFLGTALFGAVLAYMMIETGNLLVPAALHFFNNGVSFLITMSVNTEAASAVDSSIVTDSILFALIGVFLIIGAFAPLLLYAGNLLLHDKAYNIERKGARKKAKIAAITLGLVLFVGGFAVLFSGIVSMFGEFGETAVVSVSGVFTADEEQTFAFDVEEEREYMFIMMLNSPDYEAEARLTKNGGDDVYQLAAKNTTDVQMLPLAAGSYTFSLTFSETPPDDYRYTLYFRIN